MTAGQQIDALGACVPILGLGAVSYRGFTLALFADDRVHLYRGDEVNEAAFQGAFADQAAARAWIDTHTT